MTLHTYIFLTLRYMNPRFKRHLYPYDWKTLEYWRKGLLVGLPFPLLLIVTVALMALIAHTIGGQLTSNKLLTNTFMLVPSTFISYFIAKKFMPVLGKTNLYDRKTLDVQLVLIIITFAYILLESA